MSVALGPSPVASYTTANYSGQSRYQAANQQNKPAQPQFGDCGIISGPCGCCGTIATLGALAIAIPLGLKLAKPVINLLKGVVQNTVGRFLPKAAA